MNESGMQFIEPPVPNDRVVAVRIDGEFTTEDMKSLIRRSQTIVDRGEKALLFIDMAAYAGSEMGVVIEKFKNMGLLWKAFDKYAMLGDTAWMELAVKVADPLTPMMMKHFTPDKSVEAWKWLLAPEPAPVG